MIMDPKPYKRHRVALVFIGIILGFLVTLVGLMLLGEGQWSGVEAIFFSPPISLLLALIILAVEERQFKKHQ